MPVCSCGSAVYSYYTLPSAYTLRRTPSPVMMRRAGLLMVAAAAAEAVAPPAKPPHRTRSLLPGPAALPHQQQQRRSRCPALALTHFPSRAAQCG